MWTDKKGVTHVSDQPPKDEVESETMEYKEMTELNLREEKYKNEIHEIKRKYDKKIDELRIDKKNNQNIKDQEYKDRIKVIEKEKNEREIEIARNRYEFLKSREEQYRKYYHEGKTFKERDFWHNKIKQVDEARSNLMKLENKD
jgi:hypothetical protein